MTGVAVMVVDKLGRRPLLLGGVSGIVSNQFSRLILLDDTLAVVELFALLLTYLDRITDILGLCGRLYLYFFWDHTTLS